MDLDTCALTIQKYLQNNPLVVLGSGASVKYGLPSMTDLANEICLHSHQDASYTELCEKLKSGIGLEAAINSISLSEDASQTIRHAVWEYINVRDLEYFSSINHNNGIVQLLQRLLLPCGNRCTIVTTNYDRVVEYCADIVKAVPVTGFEGSLIREFELPSQSTQNKRIQARNRFVEIWKVHGSLDWFSTQEKRIKSFPLSNKILSGCHPLIIPPGNEKMITTHLEPYRSIIQLADQSIVKSNCYLCIGYGFNDEHIQQKLIQEIYKGKPIVVITKKMTPKCSELLTSGSASKYLIIEDGGNKTSLITTPTYAISVTGEYWDLDEFLKIW